MAGQKIATCCFCGSKTALVLGGRVQHELKCGACGAPLRDLKNFPIAARTERAGSKVRERGTRAVPPHAMPEDFWLPSATLGKPVKKKRKSRKRRKSLGRRIASELLDLAEDIFD